MSVGTSAETQGAGLSVVKNGQPKIQILLHIKAVQEEWQAASQLVRCIAGATGVEVPVQVADRLPRSGFLAIGVGFAGDARRRYERDTLASSAGACFIHVDESGASIVGATAADEWIGVASVLRLWGARWLSPRDQIADLRQTNNLSIPRVEGVLKARSLATVRFPHGIDDTVPRSIRDRLGFWLGFLGLEVETTAPAVTSGAANDWVSVEAHSATGAIATVRLMAESIAAAPPDVIERALRNFRTDFPGGAVRIQVEGWSPVTEMNLWLISAALARRSSKSMWRETIRTRYQAAAPWVVRFLTAWGTVFQRPADVACRLTPDSLTSLDGAATMLDRAATAGEAETWFEFWTAARAVMLTLGKRRCPLMGVTPPDEEKTAALARRAVELGVLSPRVLGLVNASP